MACLLGQRREETVFSGGVAFVAGDPDAAPEAIAARQDEAAAWPGTRFVESLAKAVAGELAVVPRRARSCSRAGSRAIPGFREPPSRHSSRLGPAVR